MDGGMVVLAVLGVGALFGLWEMLAFIPRGH
jgi:hypothetical protein